MCIDCFPPVHDRVHAHGQDKLPKNVLACGVCFIIKRRVSETRLWMHLDAVECYTTCICRLFLLANVVSRGIVSSLFTLKDFEGIIVSSHFSFQTRYRLAMTNYEVILIGSSM